MRSSKEIAFNVKIVINVVQDESERSYISILKKSDRGTRVDEKKVYYLDLQTLLTLLHNKTGTLTTKAKIGNQNVMGSISILRGQITSCALESPKGTLYGQEALERLKPLQEWQVRFEDAAPPLQKSPVLPLAPTNIKPPLEPGTLSAPAAP